jgi:clan AA aspartic protease (TIGR02281 family)
MPSGQDGAAEPASELFPLASPRRRKKRGPSALMVSVVILALLAAGWWGLLTFGPKTDIMDALNGSKPDVAEAKACLQNGNLDCALGDYRAYLKKYPDDANANAVLAILLTGTGKHREALPYYRQAARLGIATYDFHANYAASLDNTGHVDEAITENQAALKIYPTLVDVRGSLADQLVKKGRGAEAIEMLESYDRRLEANGQPAYFDYKIDHLKSRMGLVAAQSDAKAGVSSDVPLRPSQGGLIATGTVDGSLKLDFVVDSGASFVCITSDAARTLQQTGKLTRYDYRGYGTAILADGSRVPAQLVMLHSLEVGGHKAENVLACVTRGRGALLLGQSFLKRFKSWSVDNDRRVLVLKE